MNDSPQASTQATDATLSNNRAGQPANFRNFTLTAALLFLGFSVPLVQTIRFGLNSDLYSYLLLVPYVSAYLVQTILFGLRSDLSSYLLIPLVSACIARLKQPGLAPSGTPLPRIWAAAFVLAGCGALAAYFLNLSSPPHPHAQQDALASAMYSLVLFFVATCCLFLSRTTVRAIAFPLFFLFFLAPFPASAEAGFETLLQHGSSVAAQSLFQIIGTPVYRDGTLFHLPGFNMQVAPECSGIHSTITLFIVSLVAGQILLSSNRSRIILVLVVLPIALLRNGLRVATIGELCVRIGPHMIHSFIHTHGGPIFFALSLIPFTVILFFLLKLDRKNGRLPKPTL